MKQKLFSLLLVFFALGTTSVSWAYNPPDWQLVGKPLEGETFFYLDANNISSYGQEHILIFTRVQGEAVQASYQRAS